MPAPIIPYSDGTSPAATSITQRDTLGPNGVFGGDVDAQNHAITRLSGLSVGFKTTKEIWMGIRTSNKAGSGSKDDPFDVSSQAKMDALFQSYYDGNDAAEQMIFRIRDGEFTLRGSSYGYWFLRRGWRIVGEGRSQTKIIQASAIFPTFYLALFDGRYGEPEGFMSVEDLTLDLALQRTGSAGSGINATGVDFSAVHLHGPDCYIRNVDVLHPGNEDDASESFCCWIDGGYSDNLATIPHNALIEDVRIYVDSDPTGNQVSALAVTNQAQKISGPHPTPIFAKNGRILNCYVNGAKIAGGMLNHVIGNTFENIKAFGLFDDTFCCEEANVIGNNISAVQCITGSFGTQLNTHENINIRGNILTVTATPGAGVNFVNYPVKKVIVECNTFRVSGTPGTRYWAAATHDSDPSLMTELTYRGNTVETGMLFEDFGNPPASIFGQNNIDFLGAIVAPSNSTELIGPLTVTGMDDSPSTTIAEFLSDNETLGLKFTYAGIETSGSSTDGDIRIEAKGIGVAYLGASGAALGVDSFGNAFLHGSRVLASRDTGWTAATGTSNKATYATYTAPTISDPPTAVEVQAVADHLQILSRRLKAYDAAFIAHGLIGT